MRVKRIIFYIFLIIILAFVIAFVLNVWRNYKDIKSGRLPYEFVSSRFSPLLQNTNSGTIIKPTIDDDPSVGPKEAKVVVIEFGDFQCPYCKEEAPIIRKIMEKYKDKVLFVFRDFPLPGHGAAQKAGEAAECADEEGLFWYYHDTLFLNQDKLDKEENLVLLAEELGMDKTKFSECLNSGRYEKEVKKDFQDGILAGVKGTPTFFINGQLIAGVVSEEFWTKTLDYLLENL